MPLPLYKWNLLWPSIFLGWKIPASLAGKKSRSSTYRQSAVSAMGQRFFCIFFVFSGFVGFCICILTSQSSSTLHSRSFNAEIKRELFFRTFCSFLEWIQLIQKLWQYPINPIRPGIFWTFEETGEGGDLPPSFFLFSWTPGGTNLLKNGLRIKLLQKSSI